LTVTNIPNLSFEFFFENQNNCKIQQNKSTKYVLDILVLFSIFLTKPLLPKTQNYVFVFFVYVVTHFWVSTKQNEKIQKNLYKKIFGRNPKK
jgi:hypothetical protein